jgi:hypothetical protein
MSQAFGGPLFFVHVPKTAGGTFREHVRANLGNDAVYPSQYGDGVYWKISRLREAAAERGDAIRAYVGHFPYSVAVGLGIDMTTVTILRDPIERTISALRYRRAVHNLDASLEELYEDRRSFLRVIQNIQTRMFATRPDDDIEAYFTIMDIDSERFETAKQHLAAVDLLGFQERLPEFLASVEDRFGWDIGAVNDQHVSPAADVSASFRRRIATDNAIDVEFYDYALELAKH